MNRFGFSTGELPLVSQRGFALIAFFLALLAGITSQAEINETLFAYLNGMGQRFNAQFLIHITEFGNGTLAGLILILLTIAHGAMSKRVFLSIALSAVSIYTLKSLFSLPRPPAVLGIDTIHIVGEPVLTESFPSGHSATAFLIAGLLWLTYRNNPLRWMGIGVASAVALSRVGIGAHWPQDIVVGALLGWVTAWIASYLSQRPFQAKGNHISGLTLSLIACIAVFTTPVEFIQFPAIQIIRIALGIIAGCLSLYFVLRLFMLKPAVQSWVDTKLHWLVDYQNWLPMRFSKFGLVGFTGFLVDSFIYKSVMIAGLPHLVARAISYWVSATCNWYLNRRFTFNDAEHEDKSSQWLKYLAMCSGSFVLNYGSYYLLTEKYAILGGDYKFIAFLIGIGMGVVFNFGVANWVIFKRDRKDWLS